MHIKILLAGAFAALLTVLAGCNGTSTSSPSGTAASSGTSSSSAPSGNSGILTTADTVALSASHYVVSPQATMAVVTVNRSGDAAAGGATINTRRSTARRPRARIILRQVVH